MLQDISSRQGSIRLDRRKFMAIAGSLVAAGVLPRSALALAGPHSFKHGAFDITVVTDGPLTLQVAMVAVDVKPGELRALLGAAATGDTIQAEQNVLMIRSGGDVILIDCGSGTGFQETAGKIAESLKAAGTDTGAITKVIYTHAHPDHIWGAVGADGSMVFPNATHHVAENEWNFWAAEDLVTKMPKEMEGMVKGTQGKLAAIKDKVTMFKPGAEIVPGISVLDTPGHTPGHVSFELAGEDGLILIGDAITNSTVFFAHPEWKMGFDADGPTASKSRRMLLDMAVSGKKKLHGYHWAYPGLGHAEAKDGAYVYVPMT